MTDVALKNICVGSRAGVIFQDLLECAHISKMCLNYPTCLCVCTSLYPSLSLSLSLSAYM